MSTTVVDRAEASGAVETKPRRGRRVKNDADMWPWWVSQPERLVGNPTPAWESHWGGNYDRGDQCGRFMHKIEEPLFGWQWDTTRKVMATNADGLWTHPDVCLVIPRQNGKTQIVIARILYGLFFLGEKITYTAQRWETVEDVYDRIVDIIDRRPSLARRLDVNELPDGHTKAGQRGRVALTNGASLTMGPRTKAKGRGQTKVDLAIFDEAYDIKDALVSGITGAQKASDNPQTIFVSTAPVADLHPDCHQLAVMWRNGQRRAPDTYVAEWRAPDGRKRDDPETWRIAQPSHGVTVRARDIAAELRRSRTATLLAIFDADYLGWGVWPPDPDEVARAIDPAVWEALTVMDPALIGDVVLVVERTMNKRWWAIAAGQRTADGRVHVEVGYWRMVNIGQLTATLLELVEKLDPAAVIVDAKSKAAPVAPLMRDQGVEMVVTNTPQLALSTDGFLDAIEAGDVTHTGQPILTKAVGVAVTRELPRGDVVWDEVESGAAIAPLKAVSLAHWGVLEFAEEPKASASPDTGEDFIPVDLDGLGPEVSVLSASF